MAINFPVSPIPEICISPAPYEEPIEEPKSPFACMSPIRVSAEEDEYRSVLLTPPPIHSLGRPSPLSPLRPADTLIKGQGLERERFEALLRASRERNSAIGGHRKTHDLRKEVALKVHKTKQCERRALFLSKLQAPPSPSAIMEAKTPPESPAVLHYTLPSPGLNSPLAHFDMLAHRGQSADATKPWVEQVDFRLPEGERTKKLRQPTVELVGPRKRALPSLAEISARLSSQGTLPTVVPSAAVNPQETQARRLPAFLQSRANSLPKPPVSEAKPKRQLLSIGRLQITSPAETRPAAVAYQSPVGEASPVKVYPAPKTPGSPTIKVTTTVVPRISHTSPVELSESNLHALNARTTRAKDMLFTLRRRSTAPALDAHTSVGNAAIGEDLEKHVRRRSAPAELQHRDRAEFAHPVLALPGGF